MEDSLVKLTVFSVVLTYCIGGDLLIQSFEKALQNIALTETNVYIGGVNSIRKLDYNLKLVKLHETGPNNDDPYECILERQQDLYCFDNKDPKERRKMDNFNKILIIPPRNSLLLSCGTSHQGNCEYLSLDTLDKKPVEKLMFEMVSANFPNASTIGIPSEDGNVLYVAHTMTNMVDVSVLDSKVNFMIAVRPLQKDGNVQNLKVVDDNRIKYNPSLFINRIATYRIHYTSAFILGNYVYFTTIQRKKIENSPLVSKLVRITHTQDDEKVMKTYFENILSCNHNNINYNLLLSVSLVNKSGTEVLYAVFTHSTKYNQDISSYQKFVICYFILEDVDKKVSSINQIFDDVIKSCSGTNVIPRAPWIESIKCDEHGSLKSLAPDEPIEGNVLYMENKLKFSTIYAYAHERGISLFLSSDDTTVIKFAVVAWRTEKEKLHKYGIVEFSNVQTKKESFSKMVVNPTGEFMFLISNSSVARMSIIDCSIRKNCLDCLYGPECGWCALMNKCSMKDECPNNDKPLHFTEKIDECPYAIAKPKQFSVEFPRKVTLITSNVPVDVTYKCQVDDSIFPVQRKGDTFICNEFDFHKVSSFNTSLGEGIVSVALLSSVSGKYHPVVTSKVFLYQCKAFKRCQQCITGKYKCGWCRRQMTCNEDATKCQKPSDWIDYKGLGSDESLLVCPLLLNTSNKYLASGVENSITLNGRLFPEPFEKFSYLCNLNIAGQQITVKASWINSSQLICSSKDYSYADQKQDSMVGRITVSYGDAFIDSSIEVTLYKCEVKKFCSVCLNQTNPWKCGWCGTDCRLASECNVERCPNPVIEKFFPEKASINANTEVTIHGSDFGSAGDVQLVTLAGQSCVLDKSKSRESILIVCNTAKVKEEISGFINISLTLFGQDIFGMSTQKFHFVKPSMESFEPKTGPCSGGTILMLKGKHLDAGGKVAVSVGNSNCAIQGKRLYGSINCTTSGGSECSSRKRRAIKRGQIKVTFDGYSVLSPDGMSFQYVVDPLLSSVYTNKEMILRKLETFYSGGQLLKIEGQRLHLIQNPKLTFTLFGKSETFESKCKVLSDQNMTCLTPNISSSVPPNVKKLTVMLGFKMANMMNLRRYRNITVVSDPVFLPIEKQFLNTENLILIGTGLKVLDKRDVRVEIAGIPCLDISLDKTLLCTVPTEELKKLDIKEFDVKVAIGDGGLSYDVGFVKFPKPVDNTLYIVLAAAGVLLLIIVIISVCVLYRKKQLKERKDYHKDLQLHMDKIESQYARECKEAFAEYQMEMSDLTYDVDQLIAPRLKFHQYAMRVLYPGLDTHPILERDKDERTDWKVAMQSLIELLKNKDFILTFVHTLESQQSFQMTDRCIVASLLMVSLQDDVAFVTYILKELLTDLINKAGHGKRPKLLLRRTESIAEKLLTNWLAYTLYDFLNNVVGEPLFRLFAAINILLDKEPVDAVTFDAKNSLSEDRLLRTKIDFKPTLINVDYLHDDNGGIYEGIPVLSADTITQVKEKIIKYIYKNKPCSQMPFPDELQLGHFSNGKEHYLEDCDVSNVVEGEWKKLNTLEYLLNLHKIPDCSCLRLSHRANLPSFTGSAVIDDLPNVSFQTNVSSTPMLYDYANFVEPKLYHLVKPSDNEYSQSQKDDIRHSKMMAEVYLTRLLKTKETLLSFVNKLFKAIFGNCEGKRVIPPSIKFLFDFLDSEAEKLSIEDAEVHHTWKNNSLPLRFWINIIKNPNFVFDIRKSNTVDSCLSVIAQLFMDSCSPDDHKLGKDSPSNKLLYAKEIPGYKKEVKRFYKEVKESDFEEKEFYKKLDDISAEYGKSFNSCNAAFELMSYAVKYKVKLMDNLEENDLLIHAEKLQEIMEKMPDD